MKNYFLGIDGGGTKTAACLIDENYNIIGTGIAGPSSYDTVSIDDIEQNIKLAIENIKFDGQIVSVFAGLGGISKREDAILVQEIIKKIPVLKDAIIEVDNDVVNAFYSAFGEENGIIAIIGTGVVAYGINNGKSHRCGGYCYQEGDAGSSYNLGRKALQYYAKVIDKRLPESTFSLAIKDAINVYEFGDLAHFFVKATRTEIASLSKIVTANSDNLYAQNIINNAVSEVLLMIETVYRELSFNGAKLAIIGSLGNADTLYKELLLKGLKERNIEYVPLKYEAYLGSSIKAMVNFERNK